LKKKNHEKHLAGVIPLTDSESHHGRLWHDVLTPIAKDVSAIQNAVYQCAWAGCDTIWISSNYEDIGLTRKVIGDWVHDPVDWERTEGNKTLKKEIPIYYVPIVPHDRNIGRNSLSWSSLHGAFMAFKVGWSISSWVTPDVFFVAFPMGVCDYKTIRANRLNFRKGKNKIFKHGDDSILTDCLLPFTLDKDVFVQTRRHIRAGGKLDLPTAFQCYNDLGFDFLDMLWYDDIRDWDHYREYLGSDRSKEIEPQDWNKIRFSRHKLWRLNGQKNEEQD